MPSYFFLFPDENGEQEKEEGSESAAENVDKQHDGVQDEEEETDGVASSRNSHQNVKKKTGEKMDDEDIITSGSFSIIHVFTIEYSTLLCLA